MPFSISPIFQENIEITANYDAIFRFEWNGKQVEYIQHYTGPVTKEVAFANLEKNKELMEALGELYQFGTKTTEMKLTNDGKFTRIRPNKDKHEFTLAEHLQEKAQSVKNQGRKANIERITQMLQPLDSPRLHRGVEGTEVNVGGRQYRIAKTEGGGNCGLHAVLGTKQGDKYQAGATVRQEWIQKYRDNFDLVKERYLDDYIDLIGHGGQVEGRRLLEDPIKLKLEQIEADRKRKVEEKEKALDDAMKAKLDDTIFGQLEYKPAGVNVLTDLVDQAGDSEALKEEKRKRRANLLVNDDNIIALGQNVITLVSEKSEVIEASEAERKAYLLSDEARNHYFAKLGGTSHYLTDIELQIVGELYNQKVVCLTQQGDRVVQSNSNQTIDEDSVLVWKIQVEGRPDHYCRLEKIGSMV